LKISCQKLSIEKAYKQELSKVIISGKKMSQNIEREHKAENYSPEELESIPLVGYETELNNVFNDIKSICGVKVSGKYRISGKTRAIYIEGYYGSGKTFFLRKLAQRLVNEVENAIPIYVYLGSDGIALGDVYNSYVNTVKNYVQTGNFSPKIVGKPEAWKNKIDVMDKANQIIESEIKAGKLSVEAFYEGMKKLNEEGYCPILILDEFERLIYTGEGIRKTFEIRDAYKEAGYFFGKYLELTRGHIFSGAVTIAITRGILDLLQMAKNEGRTEHLKGIGEQLGINLVGHSEYFPMIQPNIVYDHKIKFQWDEDKMLHLAKVLEESQGVRISENLVKSLVRVLPVPRALLDLAKMASNKGITLDSEKNIYGIVKANFEELKSEILKARTDDNRLLVTAQSKWFDRFETLLKGGIWYIPRDKYLDVAKIWGIQYDESNNESMRKAKQKVNDYLRDLYSRELLEYEGLGAYVINKSIFAFLLGIDRLPNGQTASVDEILREIKAKVQEKRNKSKQKRSKKKEEETEELA